LHERWRELWTGNERHAALWQRRLCQWSNRQRRSDALFAVPAELLGRVRYAERTVVVLVFIERKLSGAEHGFTDAARIGRYSVKRAEQTERVGSVSSAGCAAAYAADSPLFFVRDHYPCIGERDKMVN